MSKLSATASLLLRASDFWKNEALRLSLALDTLEVLETGQPDTVSPETVLSAEDETSEKDETEEEIPLIDVTPVKSRF